jgi:SecD/SecF fusion protein
MNESTLMLLSFTLPVFAWLLGVYLARRIKMKEYGWKLGLIFSAATLAALLCYHGEPKWGIDLRGGSILIYEVDEKKTAEAKVLDAEEGLAPVQGDSYVDMNALIQSLSRRINPSGVKEMLIRQYGGSQVEIIIPDVSSSELQLIKDVIKNTGFLKFRIVADKDRNKRVCDAGELALASSDPKVRDNRFVYDGDEVVGEWIAIGKEETVPGNPVRYRVQPNSKMVTRPPVASRESLPDNLEVLATFDNEFQVEGKHLRGVQESYDEFGQPCVNFQTTPEGAALFGSLTGMNLPDKAAESYALLGIVMDEVLLSAPRIESRISSNGQISGRFTPEEVQSLVRVLRAGKLPAVLQPEPISENDISPLLGVDTIEKGTWAIGASLITVLVFMLIYYHFAGFVACLALCFNLLMIVALMIFINAAFTLPGLAGLVLTVGMSVDANVLIFERIREELKRGAALRMAIRNGFARATTTIVDANVTTLITAFILYGIGTEQIKGFAVTLILGILISMFTAIFCSRVLFDIAERRGWIKRLSMSQVIGETHFSFMSTRKMAAAFSAIAILIGMSAVVMRGSKMLDIDFTGGASVQCMLKQPMMIEDVRKRVADIADDVWVTQVNPKNRPENTVYKIDASMEDKSELQSQVVGAFTDDGSGLLVNHSLEFTDPSPIHVDKTSVYQWRSRDWLLATSPLTGVIAAPQEGEEETQPSGGEPVVPTQPDVDAAAPSAPADEPVTTGETTGETTADSAADAPTQPSSDEAIFQSQSTLTFDELINARTLEEMIEQVAERQGIAVPRMELSADGWDGRSDHGYHDWTVNFSSDIESTTTILSQLKTHVGSEPVWLSANMIGSKIAGDMKLKAITSVLLSLVAIVGYIWIRFQHITFGLAAIVALVHDVLVTLGAVALSYWLAGFLMVDEFKISLPMVAAFLTVIGYSLNDTIVVFDRIREVKGKSPDLTSEMIDTSINQTLSRTLLTSLTTLIVVAILYVFGGQGVHGFAFALLVGVFVGTYSSIFVASPALLWMTKLFADKKKSSRQARATASAR